MNVVLLAENWPPRRGGIENYLTQIAGNLPAQSVSVIAPTQDRRISVMNVGNGVKRVVRHRFFWPLIKPSWLPLYIRLHKMAKRGEIDILLCGKALFEGLLGYYLKKSFGIPYVVFTYAMEIETWSQQRGTKRKLQRVLQNADRIVYINEVTKKTLVNLGATENQLVKIWPGIHDRFFNEVSATEIQAVKSKHKLPEKYIFCVSRLVERKGIDLLIQAFSELDQTKFPDVKLVIAGEGPLLNELQTIAKQNYINTSVHFLGFVPDADLPALYDSSLFFALTPNQTATDMEGFGIVYIEAAASNKASLATNTGGVSEAVLHKETGLLVQPNVSAIREGLIYLLENSTDRTRLQQAAQQRAFTQFRWRKRILLVKGLIDAVLTEKQRAQATKS